MIFLDELDALLAVPGVARDDLFAAIRAFYNARADDPTYARLTFCLFGVAMPGDLVQDELRTPFNIGRYITLLDFTRAELGALLATGRQSKTGALIRGLRAVAAALKSDHALTPTILRGLIAATATLEHPLIGHKGPVRSTVFSADGRLVFTAGEDGVGRVWDAESGTLRATLWSPSWFIDLLALSSDGTRMASVGEARSRGESERIKLWALDPRSYRLRSLATLQGHKDLIRSIQFSPDGGRILTASDDGTARIFKTTTARPIVTLAGHEGAVLSATFSPDGARVATVSSDGTARLWDAHRGAVMRTFGPYEHPAQAVAFSPDGAKVAVAGLTGGIHVYAAATGGLLFRIADNASPISALAFSPSGNNLIAACADGALRAYDAANGQFLFPLLGHRGAVLSVAFAPDGNRVASGSTDGAARICFATIEGFFASGCRYLTKVDAATKELTAPLPELSALVRDCASLSRQLESHPSN